MNTQKYNAVEFLGRYNNEPEELKLFSVLEGLPKLTPDGGFWLAGGAIRRTLIGGNPKDSDFDFFFKDSQCYSKFREKIKKIGFKKTSETEHQETYVKGETIVQLIRIGFYKNAEELIDSFDFTITMFAYDGEDIYCGEYSLWDLARRKLALHKLTYGVASMRRMIKYTKQGFTACTGTMQSILEAVADNPSIIKSNIEYVD